MYLNGTLVCEDDTQFTPENVYRKYAYLGLNSDSIFDEIRIYNRALNLDEILDLMNISQIATTLEKNSYETPKITSLLKKRSINDSKSVPSTKFIKKIIYYLDSFSTKISSIFYLLKDIFTKN